MSRGSFHFVEHAAQMRDDDKAQPRRGAGSHAASLFERGDHAVQGAVLAKEEDFVLSVEVVVEVARRKSGSLGDITHTGFRKATITKLSPCGAQDLQSPREIALSNPAVARVSVLPFWQCASPL